MPFDYSKLKGKIAEKFNSRAEFANAVGLSERSVSLKMNGKRAWKQEEIFTACDILKIETTDIPDYFFTIKVQAN